MKKHQTKQLSVIKDLSSVKRIAIQPNSLRQIKGGVIISEDILGF